MNLEEKREELTEEQNRNLSNRIGKAKRVTQSIRNPRMLRLSDMIAIKDIMNIPIKQQIEKYGAGIDRYNTTELEYLSE